MSLCPARHRGALCVRCAPWRRGDVEEGSAISQHPRDSSAKLGRQAEECSSQASPPEETAWNVAPTSIHFRLHRNLQVQSRAGRSWSVAEAWRRRGGMEEERRHGGGELPLCLTGAETRCKAIIKTPPPWRRAVSHDGTTASRFCVLSDAAVERAQTAASSGAAHRSSDNYSSDAVLSSRRLRMKPVASRDSGRGGGGGGAACARRRARYLGQPRPPARVPASRSADCVSPIDPIRGTARDTARRPDAASARRPGGNINTGFGPRRCRQADVVKDTQLNLINLTGGGGVTWHSESGALSTHLKNKQ
ncbi:hypothetical protein SKAU_G00334700 [Synaphobranchus kaupii]|uniref:Uncharacterized protein n=1 Tax=Synaphobranchus kaupii TaxID=118154 RepID=A0A9Q1ELQ8_SYNKA|nr:hypothetical protein SKAU_G00334700 [Synaphobranchus kaupii]